MRSPIDDFIRGEQKRPVESEAWTVWDRRYAGADDLGVPDDPPTTHTPVVRDFVDRRPQLDTGAWLIDAPDSSRHLLLEPRHHDVSRRKAIQALERAGEQASGWHLLETARGGEAFGKILVDVFLLSDGTGAGRWGTAEQFTRACAHYLMRS